MKPTKQMKEAVKAGIAYLFATRGEEWVEDIEPGKLDLALGNTCILGQLDGDYESAKLRLGIVDGTELGFEITDAQASKDETDPYWHALTRTWRSAIQGLRRRKVALGRRI